jgi:glycosyltransferase involved in cell wall biosynthesis
MIKFSIVTVCLNSEKTLEYTLNSVLTQSYKNIEHILVDGGSEDRTQNIINKYPNTKKIFIRKQTKLYQAINCGIQAATGQVIGILNSDDIYESPFIIEKIAKKFISTSNSIVFGNVIYFKNNFKNISREYRGNKFVRKNLINGITPPHPATFIKKEVYDKYGLYDENYNIAGDYEFFLRTIYINKLEFSYLDLNITRMKSGGVSGKNLYSYVISTFEIAKALKYHEVFQNYLSIILRFPIKTLQFYFINKKKINKKFKILLHKKYNLFRIYDFKIIQNFKNFNFNKNFILSALNLAYLGFYAKNNITNRNDLYHWPDGIYSKSILKKIKKIPGRNLFKFFKIIKYKEIIILGEANIRSINYCKKNFTTNVSQVNLPYGNIDIILKKINNFKTHKNQLILITLPTPKQEQLAFEISKNNKNFKIICIGGSLAIASGVERAVPKIFYSYEFLWRLRYDTLRRVKRLLNTFFSFYIKKFLTNKLDNLRIEII